MTKNVPIETQRSPKEVDRLATAAREACARVEQE
jgi:hypothetical protein